MATGLSLTLNNNGPLFDLDEEKKVITSGLKVDDPEFKYEVIQNLDFSYVKTTDSDTFVHKDNNDITQYYTIKAGDSYLETGEDGERKIRKFIGWSVYKYATLSQTPELIHEAGSTENMLGMVYEYQAVQKLKLNDEDRPSASVLTGSQKSILDLKTEMFDNADDITERSIVLYAIWDEYPEIYVKDNAILSDDMINLTVDDFKQFLYSKIVNDNVTDREDGIYRNTDDLTVTISDDSVSDAYKILMDNCKAIYYEGKYYARFGGCSVEYVVTDKTGNTTHKHAQMYLNPSNAMVEIKDGKLRYVTDHIRGISEYFYYQTEENGGLPRDSVWLTNKERVKEITDAFEVLRNRDGYLVAYKFTRSDIDNVWKFIEENGIGKTKSDDALKRFIEFIEPLKVTDKMRK